MDLDRRSLLRAGAAVAVGAAGPLRVVMPAFAEAGTATLDLAGFQRYVGTDFVFAGGKRPVTMPLTSATGTAACFSLTFSGPRQALAQGTYTVDHKAFGRFAMFVVPVGRAASGQDYEAVFNRKSP